MTRRVLVAGIGNMFFGDDGFGSVVADRLVGEDVPTGVNVVDYGIRGVHLAYDLLDGDYDSVVLVDALPMGEPPGTVALVEVDEPGTFGGGLDAHSMSPASVLAALTSLGGQLPRVVVVGCQPATVQPGIGLSPPVEAAVDGAVALLARVVRTEVASPPAGRGRR